MSEGAGWVVFPSYYEMTRSPTAEGTFLGGNAKGKGKTGTEVSRSLAIFTRAIVFRGMWATRNIKST